MTNTRYNFLIITLILFCTAINSVYSQSPNPATLDSFQDGIYSPVINASSLGKFHKRSNTYSKSIRINNTEQIYTYTFYSSHRDVFPVWLNSPKNNQLVTRVRLYSSDAEKLKSAVDLLSQMSSVVSGEAIVRYEHSFTDGNFTTLNEQLRITKVKSLNLGVSMSHLKDKVYFYYFLDRSLPLFNLEDAKKFRNFIEKGKQDDLKQQMGDYIIVCEMYLLWELPISLIDKYIEHY